MKAGLPTTAVVAATDRNAVGIVEALCSYGVRVPEQVAVVGFDNTEAGARHTPPLTTVEPRFDLVGELAVRLLVTRLRGGRVRAGRHRTPTTLVVRRSCGCQTSGAAGSVPRPSPAHGDRARASRGGLPASVKALLERAARDGDRPGAAALERQAQAYLAAGSHPETLLELALALRADEARLSAGATAPAALGAAATDVLHAVLRAHLGAELRRRGELESSVATQAEIGIELFRPGHPDPRRLRWLAAAPVTAACLGLWDDADAGDAGRRLHVTGVHDPSGGLDRLLGTRATPGDFPPAALRQRVAGRPGEAVVVVPVSTERRDWGLLAVIGSVEHRATSVRDTYNHWATLLAVALEQDELIESARRQRENLERAFARERELATSVRASEERYALVTRATDDGLWDWDVAAGVVYYSPRWKSMLGYGDDAEIGDGPHEWLDRVHPDDREELAAAIAAQLGGSSIPARDRAPDPDRRGRSPLGAVPGPHRPRRRRLPGPHGGRARRPRGPEGPGRSSSAAGRCTTPRPGCPPVRCSSTGSGWRRPARTATPATTSPCSSPGSRATTTRCAPRQRRLVRRRSRTATPAAASGGPTSASCSSDVAGPRRRRRGGATGGRARPVPGAAAARGDVRRRAARAARTRPCPRSCAPPTSPCTGPGPATAG